MVRRYEQGSIGMRTDKQGAWVKHQDYEQLQAENAALKAELAAAQDDLAALRLFAANLNATHNATLKEMQITMRQELAAAKKDAFRAGMLAAAEIVERSKEFELADAIREAAK